MGNPNARPKRESIRRGDRPGSQQSNNTNDSVVSPKTTSKGTSNSNPPQIDNNMAVSVGVSLENNTMENGLANLSIQDESPTRPPLKFKSYKTGTLITNNGVPSEAFIAAFPLPEPAPVPSLKPSQLSATTPAFVPRTPQPAPTAPVNKVLPTPSTATPAFHRVQNLIHDMQSPTNADSSHQMVEQYNSFYTPRIQDHLPSTTLRTIINSPLFGHPESTTNVRKSRRRTSSSLTPASSEMLSRLLNNSSRTAAHTTTTLPSLTVLITTSLLSSMR